MKITIFEFNNYKVGDEIYCFETKEMEENYYIIKEITNENNKVYFTLIQPQLNNDEWIIPYESLQLTPPDVRQWLKDKSKSRLHLVLNKLGYKIKTVIVKEEIYGDQIITELTNLNDDFDYILDKFAENELLDIYKELT